MPSQPVVPPATTTKSPPPPSVITTATTPALQQQQQHMTENNNHSSTPPPTTLAKNNSLTGPFIKKEKRQISSKFNTSPQQGVEIETLPPLKGRLLCLQKLCFILYFFDLNLARTVIFAVFIEIYYYI